MKISVFEVNDCQAVYVNGTLHSSERFCEILSFTARELLRNAGVSVYYYDEGPDEDRFYEELDGDFPQYVEEMLTYVGG